MQCGNPGRESASRRAEPPAATQEDVWERCRPAARVIRRVGYYEIGLATGVAHALPLTAVVIIPDYECLAQPVCGRHVLVWSAHLGSGR